MASDGADGPMQKKPRMVSYPNFRPPGYDFSQDQAQGSTISGGPPPENGATPVLHLRSLSPNVVEKDIWSELGKYGEVVNVFMIKPSGQALVEFDCVETATLINEQAKAAPVHICGNPVLCSFSKSKKILTPVSKAGDVERAEHNILLLSIHNVMYPITVDVIHTICKPYGQVARIVIFRKGGTQAMVEFINVEDAVKAKKYLNGTFIYAHCCSLRVDYGKADKLVVKVNNQDTWDFTPEGPIGLDDQKGDQPRVLLPNPTPMPQGPQFYQQQQQQYHQHQQQGGYGQGWGWGHNKNDGVTGPSPNGGHGSGGLMNMGGGGGWNNPPPPPPPDARDGESMLESAQKRVLLLCKLATSAYGYGNSYQSAKYGSPTGFPESYSGGYGNSGNGDSFNNMTQMAMMASQGGASAGGGGGEASNCVVMFYGLSSQMNCDRLFNLVCLYGNVVRIKYLRSKTDSAMVQMTDPESCMEVIRHLNDLCVFGNNLRVTHSKQAFVVPDGNNGELADGSPGSKDFVGNKCNRFIHADGGLKRYAPHTIIHYYNAPPGFTAEDIRTAFEEHDAARPDMIKEIGTKNGKNSSGLLQWVKQSDANDAMVLCNHIKLEELASSVIPGKRPNTYTLKLCYSTVPFIG